MKGTILTLLLMLMTIATRTRRSDAFVVGVSSLSTSTGSNDHHSSTPITTNFKTSTVILNMSLKPAAIPLMDSGKALARSGELLIDLTSELELYGGALSASGALLRNAGDSVAQAAALMRFKTGAELACDEIREAATCLTEARDKLLQAIAEAKLDKDSGLVDTLEPMVANMEIAGSTLEAAGAGIMMRSSLSDIGGNLVECGTQLQRFSGLMKTLSPTEDQSSNGQVSSQRMAYAAEKMIEAGNELMGAPKPKPKGKGWLKG